MTEFEYWRETLSNEIGNVRFAVEGGIPKKCACASCNECLFDMSRDCNIQRMGWLCSEHIEKPKLTRKEHLLCELIEEGWIARDRGGALFWYAKAPYKLQTTWNADNSIVSQLSAVKILKEMRFEIIKWDDPEPWSVEDLLKLEVEE